MVDYKKMYTIVCGAASDALHRFSGDIDAQDILSAHFFLQQGLMRAEDVYIRTASDDYLAEGEVCT